MRRKKLNWKNKLHRSFPLWNYLISRYLLKLLSMLIKLMIVWLSNHRTSAKNQNTPLSLTILIKTSKERIETRPLFQWWRSRNIEKLIESLIRTIFPPANLSLKTWNLRAPKWLIIILPLVAKRKLMMFKKYIEKVMQNF